MGKQHVIRDVGASTDLICFFLFPFSFTGRSSIFSVFSEKEKRDKKKRKKGLCAHEVESLSFYAPTLRSTLGPHDTLFSSFFLLST